MKICPRCQKTYADDNLNFCLEDGSVLTQASAPPSPASYSGAPPTVAQQTVPSQPNWQSQPQQQPQNYGTQAPKKSSKAWVWVLLILGLVILLCGGGIFGLLYYAGQQAERL